MARRGLDTSSEPRTAEAWHVSSDPTNGWGWSEWLIAPYAAEQHSHRHQRTQEAIYVIEGLLALGLGEETRTIAAGECAIIPAGAMHRCCNPTASVTRFLLLRLPGPGLSDEVLAMICNWLWSDKVPTPRNRATLEREHDLYVLDDALERRITEARNATEATEPEGRCIVASHRDAGGGRRGAGGFVGPKHSHAICPSMDETHANASALPSPHHHRPVTAPHRTTTVPSPPSPRPTGPSPPHHRDPSCRQRAVSCFVVPHLPSFHAQIPLQPMALCFADVFLQIYGKRRAPCSDLACALPRLDNIGRGVFDMQLPKCAQPLDTGVVRIA
jgi:mannose-6-phosphate isomerase-like protein (cupin superfamily)